MNKQAFNLAQKYIPGGVNSPVRAFRAVGREPVFIARGEGAYLYDLAGKRYIDLVNSWGPLILGHLHPQVVEALQKCLSIGTSFGAPTELETELAQMIVEAVPSMEQVRLVNSGTEADMTVIRLARAYTGRNKIVKFEGCYHGHSDSFLVKAGSGALTCGVPTSPGVPEALARDTLNAPYNDLDYLENLLHREGDQIAAVIVEPIAGNMGMVLPKSGFLAGLREITQRYGVLLIFDEVITGFRVAYGGAQTYYGVYPDLTCLGKIIGGGLPVGAFGGKKEIMSLLAPEGPVYQAGTLSGNPLAVTAGIETLKILQQEGFYTQLESKGQKLAEGLREAAGKANCPVFFQQLGSMLCTFFTSEPVYDYNTAIKSDTQKYAAYFRLMLEEGIYLPPSQFETTFISAALSEADLSAIIWAAHKAFAALV